MVTMFLSSASSKLTIVTFFLSPAGSAVGSDAKATIFAAFDCSEDLISSKFLDGLFFLLLLSLTEDSISDSGTRTSRVCNASFTHAAALVSLEVGRWKCIGLGSKLDDDSVSSIPVLVSEVISAGGGGRGTSGKESFGVGYRIYLSCSLVLPFSWSRNRRENDYKTDVRHSTNIPSQVEIASFSSFFV